MNVTEVKFGTEQHTVHHMATADDKPRCAKCNRKVRPRWRYVISGQFVGPTCHRKLVASGVPEESFEQVLAVRAAMKEVIAR